MAENRFVEVTKANEIPDVTMKHIEVYGKEVLIANVGGKFYAIDDRCGHMNALLSMGQYVKNSAFVRLPFILHESQIMRTFSFVKTVSLLILSLILIKNGLPVILLSTFSSPRL